jgi:hypothetical protein
MKNRTSLIGAAVFVAIGLAVSFAQAAPPVPLYSSNIIKSEKISAGSMVITTRDSVDVVCAWYRKNLLESNGEKATEDGAHIFYTRSGATVDVEPGNRFDPGTKIGLVWDAKKYGDF